MSGWRAGGLRVDVAAAVGFVAVMGVVAFVAAMVWPSPPRAAGRPCYVTVVPAPSPEPQRSPQPPRDGR